MSRLTGEVRILFFCHSLYSDWNHGNAHFLRGVASELMFLGHQVEFYEPEDAWSYRNLLIDHGYAAIEGFRRAYPFLSGVRYDPAHLPLNGILAGAALVLAHEWNSPELIARLGHYRRRHSGLRLLFHDTHHRSVTAPLEMERFDLSAYDGVLAYGETVRRIYLENSWTDRAWTWHEAADTRLFRPFTAARKSGDIVWIGNWGDDERTEELERFLFTPARDLHLRGAVYGVRYPPAAQQAVAAAGLEYRGWLPNYRVPEVFSRFSATVHIPRAPYRTALSGIPTIRPFEALACGIPLVCAPWDDSEHLFSPGEDYLVARNADEMKNHLASLLENRQLARRLISNGRRTVLARHTCAHRARELLQIYDELRAPTLSISTAAASGMSGSKT